MNTALDKLDKVNKLLKKLLKDLQEGVMTEDQMIARVTEILKVIGERKGL